MKPLKLHYLICPIFFFFSFSAIAQQDEQVTAVYGLSDTARALLASDYILWADDLLQKAEGESDSSQYQEARLLAQQAEQILLKVYDKKDPRMAKAYCVTGLALLQTDISAAESYVKKVREIEPFAEGLSLARILYFQGMWAIFNGEDDKALGLLSSALQHTRKIDGTEDALAASIYSSIGFVMLRKAHFKEVIVKNKEAINIWLKVRGSNYPKLAHNYNNIGKAYYHLGQFHEALVYYQKALAIRERVLGSGHTELAASLLNLGLLYYDMGDIDYAVEYFFKSLDIIQRAGKTEYLPIVYTNIGNSNNYKKEYARARQYYQQALDIEQMLYPSGHPDIILTMFNIAVSYKDEYRLDKAEAYYQQALDLAKPDNPYLCALYNGIGLINMENRRYDQAEENFRKSLNSAVETYGPMHPYVANAYLNLGKLAMLRGDSNGALSCNKMALEALGYRGKNSLDHVSTLLDLCKVLSQKSNLLWQQNKAVPLQSNINGVLETCHLTLDIFEHLSRTYHKTSARQELMEMGFAISEIAISANLALSSISEKLSENSKKNAFNLAERSKSMLLYEALQESRLKQIAGIPNKLLQQEHELKAEIAYYDTKRQEQITAGVHETDTILLEIANQLRDLDDRYDALKNTFKLKFKEYFDAKHNLSTIELGEVQNSLLQPGQSMVEYMVGDSTVYIFLIQQANFEIIEVKKDFPLDKWVNQMTKEGAYGFYSLPLNEQTREREGETIRNYTDAAMQLYGKLWAPIADKLTEKVIIIPDGIIGYVPFEALLTGAPVREGIFGSYPFLLNKHQISYSYSATLLREMQQKKHHDAPKNRLLAMAPFFRGDVVELVSYVDSTNFLASLILRDSLGALPASGKEAAAIAKIWDGDAHFGQEASPDLFRELAPQYQILHLSTHGQADDRVGDYAYLGFGMPGQTDAFSKLYARDLYNLSLNADLVFLSACETGIGKLRRGEGIVSLARAFAYAGAKSIITTLWKVNDEKAKDITIDFYAYLKKGKNKDEALRLAKQRYIRKQKGRGEGAHPFFWAGFIGIGDMNALK